jgi:hypothetical protein
MRCSLARAVLPFILVSFPAGAADLAARPTCTCQTQGPDDGAGIFSSVDGEVSTLGNGGFVPAREGGPIPVGTRIVTARGSATLRFADRCKTIVVGPNSDVDVTRLGKQICIRVAHQSLGAGAGTQGGLEGAGSGAGGGAGGAAAGAGGGAAAGAGEGLGIGALGLGVVALGAVGVIAVGVGQGKGPSPVSP